MIAHDSHSSRSEDYVESPTHSRSRSTSGHRLSHPPPPFVRDAHPARVIRHSITDCENICMVPALPVTWRKPSESNRRPRKRNTRRSAGILRGNWPDGNATSPSEDPKGNHISAVVPCSEGNFYRIKKGFPSVKPPAPHGDTQSPPVSVPKPIPRETPPSVSYTIPEFPAELQKGREDKK